MNRHPHRDYALMTVLLNVLIAGLAALTRNRDGQREPIKPVDFLLLSLATYRLSRLISYDKVTSWIRLPFVQEGEGPVQPEEVQEAPRGQGLRLAVAELITCSWCSGTWIALFSFFGLKLLPGLARPFLTIAAISGAEQLLDALFGLLHWTTARVRTE